MECTEFAVDMRKMTPESRKEVARMNHLLFELNQTDPSTEEYGRKLKELFDDRIGEGSYVGPGLHGAALDQITIGKGARINNNALFMARGGVTIEDHVLIAADASIITNNHDFYDREILTCKPVLIQEGAWIGARAIILPGVSIGKHAVVGAGSVVTKDVPDYAVAVGNPARVVRMLDPQKFEKE